MNASAFTLQHGETELDRQRQPYIVCAFYTDAYEEEVKALTASLNQVGIDHHIRHYPDRGFWEANTRIKPEFIADCLERFAGRDIVYIDADAVVRGALPLFDQIDCDIGVFKAPAEPEGGTRYSHPYLTGTLYLANNQKVRAFVEEWVRAQAGMVLGVDQDSFAQALQVHPELRLHPLPEAYVKIFDRGTEPALIEHFQASRRQPKLQRRIKHWRNRILGILFLLFLALLIVWIWG